MPITIIGPQQAAFPALTYPAMIDVKPTWDWQDGWEFRPDLELLGAAATSGRELSSCQIGRKYGQIKLPWEEDTGITLAWGDTVQSWVRVRMVGQQGMNVAWVGRVSGEARDVQGASMGSSGEQAWQCYGPGQILRKVPISRSFWEDKDLGWVPSMNDRDGRQAILGNRAASWGAPSYLYGDGFPWTHYDYAEYILKRFVDESATGGPAWSLGGQTDVLKDLIDVIRFGTTQTAADVLRELIPTRLGIDYTIRPTDDGFEVFVFALLAGEYSFGGHTLPRNPNIARVRVGLDSDKIQTRVSTTSDHQYGRIRVLGRRIVVCCSLCGGQVNQFGLIPGSLARKWSPALQTEYHQCDELEGITTWESYDRYRGQDKFAAVYQQFGAPPGGGTIDVEVPDAELWYLAPRTVVGLDNEEFSPTLRTSGAQHRILRDDTDRLAAVMAGAIARYATRRARASITVRGLLPWSGLIGQILTVIDEGGQQQQIQAPITSVRWSPGEDPTTVIETGSPL